MNGYGYKLKKLRESKDMTRTELAELLKISTSSITMYENEERIPRDSLKIELAKIFSTTVEYIFFEK